MTADQLIAGIVQWAESRPDVRAVALVGSRARVDRPADRFSDVDVIMFARQPAALVREVAWVAELGRPIINCIENPQLGTDAPWAPVLERRVLYEDGIELEMTFVSAGKLRALWRYLQTRRRMPGTLSRVLGRALAAIDRAVEEYLINARPGIRALVDKDGHLTAAIQAVVHGQPYAPEIPTQAQLDELIQDFFFHVFVTARRLARGELWVAKVCCDVQLKRLLLRALEWQAHVQGRNDTWYDGRFLEQWADPEALRQLRGVYAHYDRADVRRALLVTCGLFRQVARDIAERMGHRYPEVDDEVMSLVATLLDESAGG